MRTPMTLLAVAVLAATPAAAAGGRERPQPTERTAPSAGTADRASAADAAPPPAARMLQPACAARSLPPPAPLAGCHLRGDDWFDDLLTCPEPLPGTVIVSDFTVTPSLDVDTTDPVAKVYEVECPCDGVLYLTRQGGMVHADWR